MHSDLAAQIEGFVTHSPEWDDGQLLALIQGHRGAAAAQAAAVLLGTGFQAQRWNLGAGPNAPTLTKMTSFAELCVLRSRSRLLRAVVDGGAPAALGHLGLDRPGWLRYLCRTRRPEEPRELPGEAFTESSLFVLATDWTESRGAVARGIVDASRAANVIEALKLALEVLPGDPGIEVARQRGGVARALLTSAEMAMAVRSRGASASPNDSDQSARRRLGV